MGAHSRLRETDGKAEFVTAAGSARLDRRGPARCSASRAPPLEPLGAYKPLDLPTDPDALFAKLKAQAPRCTAPACTTRCSCSSATTCARRRRRRRSVPRSTKSRRASPASSSSATSPTPRARAGVAVAMTDETNHIRQVLIFDPKTSQLLAEEERVVAGNVFGWPSGTLMGSTTYLVHAVVGSNSEVPPAQK